MKKWLIVACIGIMACCSRIDFGIRYMEYSAEKEITGLFDFSGAKKKTIQRDFEELSIAAKKKIFPVLSRQLAAFGNFQDVYQFQKDLLADRSLLVDDADQFADQLLTQVGPEEYAQLLLHYGEKIEETKEKFSKPEEFRKQEKQKIVRVFEYFLDSLDSDQEQRIDQFVAKNNFPYGLQIKNQESYLELLRATDGKMDRLKTLAHKFISDPASTELKDFRLAREAYFTDLTSLFAEVLAKASPAQKALLGKAAGNLANDLQTLVKDLH